MVLGRDEMTEVIKAVILSRSSIMMKQHKLGVDFRTNFSVKY